MGRHPASRVVGAPRVGVLYYRAHEVSGNNGLRARSGRRRGRHRTGRRDTDLRLVAALGTRRRCTTRSRTLDALVVTVLAAGGTTPATVGAGGDDEAWDVERLRALDIPMLQGLALTSQPCGMGRHPTTASPRSTPPPRSRSPSSTAGSSPCRSPSRRSTPTDCPATSPTRSGVPASRGSRSTTPGCATSHRPQRKVALVLSAYPTKHARIGNAVGLDTPVSAIRLLRRMRDAGYDLGAPARSRLDPLPDGEDPTPRPATR